MGTKEYTLSKETTALVNCLRSLSRLTGELYQALVQCNAGEEDGILSRQIFTMLQGARKELLNEIAQEINIRVERDEDFL